MTGSEFWESSLPEIIDRIQSADRKRKQEIGNLFMLAEIISNRMFRDKDTPAVMPWDYYPKLFTEDKASYEDQQRIKELENYKEKRRRAMDRYNFARSGQEVIE
jgi:hypothetical protein